MGLLYKWKLRRLGIVPVPHYAPDISLSAIDYIFPVSTNRRLARAERRIEKFLENTAPDRFNGDFFDTYTEQEEQMLITQLTMQTSWHNSVNGAIALKHQSELVRLRAALQQAQAVILQMDKEISSLQEQYDQHN